MLSDGDARESVGGWLGASWVAAHGKSRPRDEREEEELRTCLVRDLEARGAKPADAKTEVNRLIAAGGHISKRNMLRLERKALGIEMNRAVDDSVIRPAACMRSSDPARMVGLPASAREPARLQNWKNANGSAATGLANSATSSFPAPGQSPRRKVGITGTRKGECGREEPAGVDAGISTSDITGPLHSGAARHSAAVQVTKWSELAQYSQQQEERDLVRRREEKRAKQEKVRRDLEQQVAERSERSRRAKDEDRHHLEQREAEFARWRADQDAKELDAKTKMLLIRKDQDEQAELTTRRREEEMNEKMAEDRRLLEMAESALELEKRNIERRRQHERAKERRWAQESLQGVKNKSAERQQRIQEELEHLQNYEQMLEREEVRNQQPKNEPKSASCIPSLPSNKYRGRDVYSDDYISAELDRLNQQKMNAEIRKAAERKAGLMANQEFVFGQIAERKERQADEQKSKEALKQWALEARQDELDAEKRRAEGVRMNSICYRQDLEKQIAANKALLMNMPDKLSPIERSINRNLLTEAAQGLRLS